MISIGPWVWETKAWAPHWRAPDGVTAIIDVRSVPQMSVAGVSLGFGVFASDVGLGSDYRVFDDIPKESDRTVFASMLGVRTVDGTTLNEWLASFFTLHADPFGQTASKPILPSGRSMEIWLGGKMYSQAFDVNAALCASAITVMQEDYRKIAAQDDLLARKVLGYWGVQLKIDNPQDVFIPADMAKVLPVAPATTITESFNQADSTTLGPDLTWTQDRGTWSTKSNQVTKTTDSAGQGDNARADTALSSADHYAQVVITAVGGTYQGPACRMAASINFYSSVTGSTSDNNLYLVKEVASAQTNISTTAATLAASDVLKVQSNGSTISDYVNGVVKNSVTDTAITGNLRCGLNQGLVSATGVMDTFEAADLAATGGGPLTFGGNLVHGSLIRGGRLAA